jgi:hypothetical protein
MSCPFIITVVTEFVVIIEIRFWDVLSQFSPMNTSTNCFCSTHVNVIFQIVMRPVRYSVQSRLFGKLKCEIYVDST